MPLLPAQDHKRAYDNDEGPNTGGMGAYAPLPWLPEDGVSTIVDVIARPVAEEMVRRGTPYQGLLYVGAAWGPEGPAVVEFNARFGDPETQAVLALLKTPLGEVLHAVAAGTLADLPPLEWYDEYAVTVVLAALSLGPALITVVTKWGKTLEPKRAMRVRGWRKIGAAITRWPGPILVATIAVALVGLLAIPGYKTSYDDRQYMPADLTSDRKSVV